MCESSRILVSWIQTGFRHCGRLTRTMSLLPISPCLSKLRITFAMDQQVYDSMHDITAPHHTTSHHSACRAAAGGTALLPMPVPSSQAHRLPLKLKPTYVRLLNPSVNMGPTGKLYQNT
mgnify:CR=1 FL=1